MELEFKIKMCHGLISIVLIATASVFSSFAQPVQPKYIPNWKLNSFGIAYNTSDAQFFRPLTLDYMKKVSSFDYGNSPYVIDEKQFEAIPYSAVFYQRLVTQISWMNSKNNDEIRGGISYEEIHDKINYFRNYTTSNKESIDESFGYEDISQITRINSVYFKSITPFWKFLKFYAGMGAEFDFSFSAITKVTQTLSIHDSTGTLITPFGYGFSQGFQSKSKIYFGAIAIAGMEININKWIIANKEKFGSGIQQIIKGKSYGKYRQQLQLNLRYFFH